MAYQVPNFRLAQELARRMTAQTGKEYYISPSVGGFYSVEERSGVGTGVKKTGGGGAPVTQPSTQPTQAPRTSEQYANDLVSSMDNYWKRQTDFMGDYVKNNPFVFDEELAKKSSKAEYEPYYSELLDDYLADVGVKRDTIQDEGKLLMALKTTPSGTAGEATRSYDRAVAQAEEGFAGSGMFFSGIKNRRLGQAEVERGYDVGTMATGVQRKSRDIGREQETAIAGGVEQRRGEQTKQYNLGIQQAFTRQFPSSSAGVLAGYTIPEFLRV